jgi:resuscitation-promoting factor RpfA
MIGEQPHDRAFDEYLAGNSELSLRYRREATELPPVKLDCVIAATAHREVGHRAQWFKLSYLRAWQVPVALAALTVIAVGITLKMAMRDERAAAPPSANSSGVVYERTQVSPKLADRGDSPHTSSQAPAVTGGVLIEKPDATGSTEFRAAPGSENAVPDTRTPTTAEADRGALLTRRESAPLKPEASSALAAKPSAEEPPVQRVLDAASQPRTAQAERSAQSKAKRKAHAEQRKAAERASASKTKAAAAPAADDAQPPAAAAAQEAPKADTPTVYGADSPERWLARILVLRRQGSVAEAHVQLARFKQRYPDYPLPAELK